MKRLSKKQQDTERRKVAIQATLMLLNESRQKPETVSIAQSTVRFADMMLAIFGIDLDTGRILRCARCGAFYLKRRANQASCSAACSAVLRQRKHVLSGTKAYRVTGKSENAPRSKAESVI